MTRSAGLALLLSGVLILGAFPSRPKANIDADPGNCRGGDSNHALCLGIKYVVYQSPVGPVISRNDANRNIALLNNMWGRCQIHFEIDDFQVVNPGDFGLPFHTADYSDLDEIRSRFASDKDLLIVTTGAWNRAGSLGDSHANAWTSMPGSSPYGTVIEQSVGTFANIIGHELGHYLNLQHMNGQLDLMNPVIFRDSTELQPSQCETARSTVKYYWSKMLR